MSSYTSIVLSCIVLASICVLSFAGTYCYKSGYGSRYCTYGCCSYEYDGCCDYSYSSSYTTWYIYAQWWFWLIWIAIFIGIVVTVVCCRRRRATSGAIVRSPAPGVIVQSSTVQTAAYPQGVYPGGAYPQGVYPGGAYPQGVSPAPNQQYDGGQAYGYTEPAGYGYDNKATAPTDNPPPYAAS